MFAPICIFTYNRLNETILTINALKNNYLAPNSELFIFSDGPKNLNEINKVEEVREFIKSITGFKAVQIMESSENMGLASSVINGVTNILMNYESVIVLEDDLVCSPNFLNFMNKALVFYQKNPIIQSINGFSFALTYTKSEVYFQSRTGSWGWATWKDRWNTKIFDKEIIKSQIKDDPKIIKQFKKHSGADLPKMLKKTLTGKNDSWYIFWAFDHFIKKTYSVFPIYSFVTNIGFNVNSTHCKGINSYKSIPVNNEKTEFNFPVFQLSEQKTTRAFLDYFTRLNKIIFRFKLLKSHIGRVQVLNELNMKLGFSNSKWKD